jgi:hypothetical protein
MVKRPCCRIALALPGKGGGETQIEQAPARRSTLFHHARRSQHYSRNHEYFSYAGEKMSEKPVQDTNVQELLGPLLDYYWWQQMTVSNAA